MNIKNGKKLSKIMAVSTAIAMTVPGISALAETTQTGNYEVTSQGTVATSATVTNPEVTVDIYHLGKTDADLLNASPADYTKILLQRNQMTSDKGAYKFVLNFGDDTPTGEYTIRISSTGATEVKTEKFVYSNPNDYKTAVEAMNKATTVTELETIIDTYKLSVGIDLTEDFGADKGTVLNIMLNTIKESNLDANDTTTAKKCFNACVALAKLNSGKGNIAEYVAGENPVFDLANASLTDWYGKSYVSDTVKTSFNSRLSNKNFKSVKALYSAMPEAYVLAVVEKSGSNSGIKEVIDGFSSEIGENANSLTEKKLTSLSGTNYATYAELKSAITKLKNTSTGSGSSSGGSGGSYGSSKQYPKPEETTDKTEDKDGELNYYVFDDLEDVSWAKESICKLAEMGVLRGKEYRMFYPNDTVKREEFVKMLTVAFGLDTEGKTCNFTDVDADEWYAAFVAAAKEAGIVNGVSDTEFGVEMDISRQDLAVMAYNAAVKQGANFGEVSSAKFADDESIADYAKDAVYALKTAEIINGVDGKNFAPNDTATRAEAAKILYSLIKFMA